MSARAEKVPLNRDVDWRPDAVSVACLYLLLEQVSFESWVLPFWEFLGFEVKPPVVATRKTGDRFNPGFDQGFREFFRVEIGSDTLDLFAGMKVEMNLAER